MRYVNVSFIGIECFYCWKSFSYCIRISHTIADINHADYIADSRIFVRTQKANRNTIWFSVSDNFTLFAASLLKFITKCFVIMLDCWCAYKHAHALAPVYIRPFLCVDCSGTTDNLLVAWQLRVHKLCCRIQATYHQFEWLQCRSVQSNEHLWLVVEWMMMSIQIWNSANFPDVDLGIWSRLYQSEKMQSLRVSLRSNGITYGDHKGYH